MYGFVHSELMHKEMWSACRSLKLIIFAYQCLKASSGLIVQMQHSANNCFVFEKLLRWVGFN
jgi:hypothetical protein